MFFFGGHILWDVKCQKICGTVRKLSPSVILDLDLKWVAARCFQVAVVNDDIHTDLCVYSIDIGSEYDLNE